MASVRTEKTRSVLCFAALKRCIGIGWDWCPSRTYDRVEYDVRVLIEFDASGRRESGCKKSMMTVSFNSRRRTVWVLRGMSGRGGLLLGV